jgi:tetratricopeptide (TPR) repeat protein
MVIFRDFIVKHLIGFWDHIMKHLNVVNIAAVNFTAIFFGTILYFCLANIASERFWFNLLISLLGGLIGWVLGNVASPVNHDEQKTFSELTKVVATFFSGYLVSKLDRFLENALFTSNQINQTSWLSACFFFSALIIISVTVFLNRTYALKPISKPELAEMFNNIGIKCLDQGEYMEAVYSFEKSLTSKPDFSEVLNNKGLALEKLGRKLEAIEAFNQAIAINPKFEKANENLRRLLG